MTGDKLHSGQEGVCPVELRVELQEDQRDFLGERLSHPLEHPGDSLSSPALRGGVGGSLLLSHTKSRGAAI